MAEKKYRWIASSSDGAFQDESKKLFSSKEDCYNDMRNAALEKMKWNTEYRNDFFDAETITYGVAFSKEKIIHESYSGVYTYEIIEVEKKHHVELSDKEIKMICHALTSTIRHNNESVSSMYSICGSTQETKEISLAIALGNKGMADLTEYLQTKIME